MNNRLATLIRHLAIGTLTGLFSGAVAVGLGSRVAMRITALMTEDRLQGQLTEAQARVGEITVGGTFFLIFFAAVVLGIYAGLLYRVTSGWLPNKKTWFRGLIFGVILLLLHGTAIIEGDNVDFDRFGSTTINIGMFMLMPLAFGLIAAYTDGWLERHYPPFNVHFKTLLLYLPGILGGLFLLPLAIGMIDSLSPNSDNSQLTNVGQAWLTLVMIGVIVFSLVFEPTIKHLRYTLYIRAAVLIVPMLYGGVLLIEAIREILDQGA